MTHEAPSPAFDPPPSTMSREAFVARFGGVYEHSPWVAEAVFDAGLSPDHDKPEALGSAMAAAVAAAAAGAQLALIRAHPDLAGRVSVADLTAASRNEQAGAGLDRCSPEEFQQFQQLNATYKERFGFPFILAVSGLDRDAILENFAARVGNDAETEFAEALRQIDRIAAIRLQAIARS